MSHPLIELVDVVKTFTVYEKTGRVRRRRTEVRAVDRLSFSVEPGAMLGYIGPNGAGNRPRSRC
jgi:ABC-2 type transport system ATP-binding protein